MTQDRNKAFLVSRENEVWVHTYELIPGQVTTIGRAATNRIVVPDDVCSRNHCEVFRIGDCWILRDLGSRNGTQINGHTVQGDWTLESGQHIAIGEFILGFTHSVDSLTKIPASPTGVPPRLNSDSELAILHRRGMTSFGTGAAIHRDRLAATLKKIYQLGLDMGTADTPQELAEVVLRSLTAETVTQISSVQLLPDTKGKPDPAKLELVAHLEVQGKTYVPVSESLSRIALSSHEAILASDVAEDDSLSESKSLRDIMAASVICAPIRKDKKVYGLIHMYSSNVDNPLDADDLDFTLAVADQMAVALTNLKLRDNLETDLSKTKGQNKQLLRQLEVSSKLIGVSDAMDELRNTISLIGPTDATALIRGESGVGKELVARSIHFASKRRAGPLVCMNCAALSESLLESELFGHEKGAFTGATEQKMGRFEQAHSGTLFLDEVGEMTASIQAKFLRVLEGHPFERVGGRKQITVDVRVVAATNRDLEEAVQKGDFRKDLYFRLHVAEIRVKPLRERRDDIEELANFFLKRFVERTGRPIEKFTPSAMAALVEYDWPGNVRELQNTVERTVIMCTNNQVKASDIQLSTLSHLFPQEVGQASPQPSANYRKRSLADLEREHILATLDETNWNKSQAAQILEIERSTLDRKLKRYEVSRPEDPKKR